MPVTGTMNDRPDWARLLHKQLTVDVVDLLPGDGRDDWLHDDVIDAVNAVLCGHYGHEIVDDQCGLPEHRYCLWCSKLESEL